MKISFIIPILNEAESLNILHNEILQHIDNYEYEIIFIDDGSTDDSFSVLSAIADKDRQVKVIKFRRNFGKAEALSVGFDYACGDVVFTLDADLQDDPAEIPHFIEKINEGWDIVCGWKQKRHDPLMKVYPSKFFNLITSATFGLKLHDYNCGFKAFKNEVVREIDLYGEMHRYIPALAQAKGFKVTEIPVNHRVRKFGQSKYGLNRFVRGYLDLFTVKLVTKFNKSPLYLFGGLGSLFAGTGFILALYLTFMRMVRMVYLTNRPLLFLSILLIIMGVQFFSIGLIGELLVNQAGKNYRRDKISVEKVLNHEIDA